MQPTAPLKTDRLDSIDSLRGLVIILMALDHTRDFFGAFTWAGPENAALASPALFFTRWNTHFCAPTFVMLAGLGAFLSLSRGMSKPKLAAFLITRGIWLVILELTVVHFGWTLDWNLRQGMLQVIWAIGWSMVGLSLLICFPAWLAGLLGCCIIAGHNYLDGLSGSKIVTAIPWLSWILGERGWFWDLLHVPYRAFSPAQGYQYFNLYPLLPWFGILCVGYGLGPILKLATAARRKTLLSLGLLAIVTFIALRYLNRYGDPAPWRIIAEGDSTNLLRTTMSFLACTKYPPSLLYTLMTLGPALILLVLLEGPWTWLKRFLTTYGRVPLFFYLVHLPVIHGLAKLAAWYEGPGPRGFGLSPLRKGYDLPDVYLVWALVILALYFPCQGYGWLKRRYGGILKYL
jgi:uncharacterized membrane protein